MPINIPIARFHQWILNSYGSMRPLALLRINLALIAWARYGRDLHLFEAQRNASVLFAAIPFFILSTTTLLGLFSRTSSLLFGLLLFYMATYIAGEAPQIDWRYNHTYLLGSLTILMAASPCGRSYSLDRYFAVKKARRDGSELPLESGSLLGAHPICLQISSVYFWAALDKLTPLFYSGDRIQQIMYQFYFGIDPNPLIESNLLCALLAISVIILEFVLSIGMYVPRSRLVLMAAGATMHSVFTFCFPFKRILLQ